MQIPLLFHLIELVARVLGVGGVVVMFKPIGWQETLEQLLPEAL